MTKIKNTYLKIIEHASAIEDILNTLHQKSMYLKVTYDKLMSENTTIDVITTDTFAFQNNILALKIEYNKNLYKKISNQIYGDYYKLIKYIIQYVNEYIKNTEIYLVDETIKNSIKLIENLEPYRINNPKCDTVYNIKTSQKIYNYIIDILEILNKNYSKCHDKLRIRKKSFNNGINIENYINSIKYKNDELKNNIELFSEFFHKYNEYHIKYLYSLEKDLKNLYQNTAIEINFNNINLEKDTYKEIVDASNNIIITKNNDKWGNRYYLPSFKNILKINFFIFIGLLIYQINY